ncbi:GNAT family N-acetyltransferase [Streptomyces sp. LP05-1]|uniref:GNAT family N-acetyltransferase n=1 Tax=Streptomyces pyxinae TaxID=2970734 RepID=A0ABT2CEQ7_9ACTN|nr:GNAT family N-acyltransferase [Streptomyces sp. LP05-1]MCS0635805.1 GNAT family N-acetyltransferase [Streptomyces sp. LP05-1]
MLTTTTTGTAPAAGPATTTQPAIATGTATGTGYATSVAASEEQVRAAQRLRHQVFTRELGARIDTPLAGHDIDAFDALADHLIVTEQATGEVVGTYRMLPPGRTEASYAGGEFDLQELAGIRSDLIEVGRACVHPDHRDGAVIAMMWSGLARYALLSGHRYLGGCASVPLDDGGRAAAHAWLLGTGKHAAPEGFRVHPRQPWNPSGPSDGPPSQALLPPLLRGYLRLGAWMCGAPAHDPEFDVADFFVLLDLERLSDRHRRFFLGEAR